MSKFNCTTPWGPEKDHICKNETIGLNPQKLYESYFKFRNASSLQNCPKSCFLMNIRFATEKTNIQTYINGKRSGVILFKFREIITVSSDHYSYIWLNFIAEVGGYVGLFLGYSVYQITDILDKILPKIAF